jgi:hypothetical protein
MIGDWISSYNGDTSRVSKLLEEKILWSKNSTVWFCISSSLILQTNWATFIEYWDSFLCVDDDCPILISKDYGCSLLFRPLGDIVKIDVTIPNVLKFNKLVNKENR